MTGRPAHRGGTCGTPQLCTAAEQRQAQRDAAIITRIRAAAAASRVSDMFGNPCIPVHELLSLLDGPA